MFYEILHNNFWTQADLSEILDENLYVFKLNKYSLVILVN